MVWIIVIIIHFPWAPQSLVALISRNTCRYSRTVKNSLHFSRTVWEMPVWGLEAFSRIWSLIKTIMLVAEYKNSENSGDFFTRPILMHKEVWDKINVWKHNKIVANNECYLRLDTMSYVLVIRGAQEYQSVWQPTFDNRQNMSF